MAMGAADVVPGVSGGTIAFISGIYEELLNSLKSFNLQAVKLLFQKGFGAFWKHINGWFMLFLVSGIAISVFSLSKLVLYLLENYPALIWSFFFGLVVASAIFVASTIKKWGWGVIVSALIGTALAFYITIATPAHTPEQMWFVFIAGVVAICAMILPGISGSFILLLMGKYQYILHALNELIFDIILVFVAGCFIGLTSFSHVLSWMLRKYHNATVALLTGFMFGSLNKVWPWKKVIESEVINGEVKILRESNVWPQAYTEITGNPNYLGWCVLLAVAGFIMIWLIEKAANKKHKII
jgi:putative membrane protein